jgi:hypothetical protein
VPRRRHTKALADDSELEFEYFLASELKMTVAQLRQMDNDEFVHWSMFYARKAQATELANKRG